ncbi:hypothetical protein EV421DRAFT_1697540, partial [Armillaria borealis]
LSMLDILKRYSLVSVSLKTFLQILLPMCMHQYSHPLWNLQHVELAVSVIYSLLSSSGERIALRVASNYLSGLVSGN